METKKVEVKKAKEIAPILTDKSKENLLKMALDAFLAQQARVSEVKVLLKPMEISLKEKKETLEGLAEQSFAEGQDKLIIGSTLITRTYKHEPVYADAKRLPLTVLLKVLVKNFKKDLTIFIQDVTNSKITNLLNNAENISLVQRSKNKFAKKERKLYKLLGITGVIRKVSYNIKPIK